MSQTSAPRQFRRQPVSRSGANSIATVSPREISPSSASCQFGENRRTAFEFEFRFEFSAICRSPYQANDNLLAAMYSITDFVYSNL